MSIRFNGQTDRWKYIPMDKKMGIKTHGQIDGWAYKLLGIQADGQTNSTEAYGQAE
jgi:hypothetical protein